MRIAATIVNGFGKALNAGPCTFILYVQLMLVSSASLRFTVGGALQNAQTLFRVVFSRSRHAQ
jgi:hypothetical protein